MDASINVAVENLRKAVTCCVCLEFYSFPVSLACGHGFCKICIHNVMKVKSVCPVCSRSFSKRNIVSEDHLHRKIEGVASFLNGNVFKAEGQLKGDETLKTQKITTPIPKASNNQKSQSSSSSSKATISIPTAARAKPPRLFAVGDLVNVTARTWAGINKPGGTGRVVHCNECEGPDGKQGIYYEYSIRYVLDGSLETEVDEAFLEPYVELTRSSRKSRPDAASNNEATTESNSSTTEREGAVQCESGAKRYVAPVYSNAHILSAKRTRGESANLYWSEHDPVDALVSTSAQHHSASKATASSRRDEVANPTDRKIVLLSTALDPSLQTRLQDLADACEGVSVVHSFSDQVTHLVVSVDKRKVMQQRTMKYMQALLSGIWVVTIDWVVKSLDNHVIQDEASFEVNKNCKAQCDGAPARARLAAAGVVEPTEAPPPSLRVTTPLFASVTVLIFGQYPQSVPPRSDIQFLLQRGGATVCGTLAAFVHVAAQSTKASRKEKNLVVVCSAKEYADELYDSVVVVGSTEKSMRDVCAAYHICVVSTAWVLDSVGNYKIQPLEDSFD